MTRRTSWLVLILWATFYGLTRFTNLLLLPVFNDEAIYIRWASIIREDPAHLFISAIDGKPWFFMWLNSLTLGVFDDFLMSGRIISVVSGAMTVVGIYFIGRRLYTPEVGCLAGLIYLLFPFSVIHDRLALVDSLLTAFATGLILTAIQLGNDLRVYVRSLVLGVIIGLGFLTKTPFMLFFIFPPLALLFFFEYRDVRLWKGLALAYGIAVFVALPYLMYVPPMQLPGVDKYFHNARFFRDIASTLNFQNPVFLDNIKEFWGYLVVYVTWPLLAVFLVAIVQGARSRDKRAAFLALWFFLPALPILVFTKDNFSRYFLFCMPACALMIGQALCAILTRMWGKAARWPRGQTWAPVLTLFLLALLLTPSVRMDFAVITDPVEAGWVNSDRWQYIDSEFSGYGIREAVEYFLKEAERNEVRIIFSPVWGHPEDALYLYLKDKPNIKMYDGWWTSMMPVIPGNMTTLPVYKSNYQGGIITNLSLQEFSGREVYFVARDHAVSPEKVLIENPAFRRIGAYKKLKRDHSFSVYKRIQG